MQIGGIVPRKPDPKGKQFNPYKDEGIFVQKNVPITASSKIAKYITENQLLEENSKKKKKKEKRLGDYKSDEFKMCKDVIMYSDGKNYDDKEVEKSCIDLAIDG